MKTRTYIAIGIVIVSLLIYISWGGGNYNVKGKYVARENNEHVIELEGPGEVSGNYTYYIKKVAVNKGTWQYYDEAWPKIRFNNWKNQGVYKGEVDSLPTIYFVQLNGTKLEFHPDLYEDDFIKK